MIRHSLAVALVATLAGCATAPLSFINDQQVFHRQVLNRFPVRLLAIDGSYTAFRPVPIAPGTHSLLLAAFPVAGFRVPPEKTYPMTIAPCTRYYIAAQRASPLLQDWELVVEETYPVAGCDPASELEKAKTAAISGIAPRTSSVLETSPASTTSALAQSPSR